MNFKLGNALTKLEREWKYRIEHPESERRIAPKGELIINESSPDITQFDNIDFYGEIARVARQWKKEGKI